MCGRSGLLGEQCTNGCPYKRWASNSLVWAAKERKYKNSLDLDLREGCPTTYRILLPPKKTNMIDAVYWAEMIYQGVHEEQENYQEFQENPRRREIEEMTGSGQIKRNR